MTDAGFFVVIVGINLISNAEKRYDIGFIPLCVYTRYFRLSTLDLLNFLTSKIIID